MVEISPSPLFLDSLVDLAAFCFIVAILLLSFVSLVFVFHLYLKSRSSRHLQSFNSLWSVRFLLVLFVTLWALNELLRLPFFRRRYLYPFLPPLTETQQANLCRIHVVCSLGFLQPGFLVTLLFLVNVSVKKSTPRGSWAFVFVSATCFPVFLLQVLFVFGSTIEFRLPEIFQRSWVVVKNDFGVDSVFCMYPLMSCIIFGAFGVWYLAAFSLSCFKVLSLVINKGLRVRLYGLALAVMITLPLELVSLGFSVLWTPKDRAYGVLALTVFLTALLIAAAGEGILVIRPIADSLAAGEEIQLGSGFLQAEEEEEEEREIEVAERRCHTVQV